MRTAFVPVGAKAVSSVVPPVFRGDSAAALDHERYRARPGPAFLPVGSGSEFALLAPYRLSASPVFLFGRGALLLSR